MRTFRCPDCEAEVKTLGREVWHRCQGKMKRMEERPPPERAGQ